MIETYPAGDTRQFTIVTSISPDSVPVLKITEPVSLNVTSISAVASDSTHHYALYTMPASVGIRQTYIGEWTAVRTFNASAYNFKRRFLFNVEPVNIG